MPQCTSLPTQESKVPKYEHREVVVDKNGLPRQAGSSQAEGKFIKEFRKAAEGNLFVFSKGVMGRDYLTKRLHLPVCEFLQRTPPFRNLVLMPRYHGKTSITSHCLPLHILIQPKEMNLYFPGINGAECRILMAGETAKRAEDNLRVVSAAFESNQVFRAFWPQMCWPGHPRKFTKVWNNQGIIIPRETSWPDPTVRAIGVGGAITGARPNVLIKDDLISFEAANSDVVMAEAIEWHIVSRALLDEYEKETSLQSLEIISGTRWAVYDLYSHIIDNDPSVEVLGERFHRIIADGKILWPERVTEAKIEQLRREFGTMFYLLFLNSAADPSLTDFDLAEVRDFELQGGKLRFDADERDHLLEDRLKRGGANDSEESSQRVIPRGIPLMSPEWNSLWEGRKEYLRVKYG